MTTTVTTTVKKGKNKNGGFPKLPEDEERQRALLAPFRERSVNAEHYDVKMKFWQDIIAQYCEAKGEAIFTVREVQTAFMRGVQLPACLHDVVVDLLQKRKIRLRAEYEYDPLNSWSGWAMNSFVRKPFAWGVTKVKSNLGLMDPSAQNSQQQYVYLSVVQASCKSLQSDVLHSHQGKLVHYNDFKRLCETADLNLTEDGLHLILLTLQRQMKIGLEYEQKSTDQHIHFVKIPTQNQPDVSITEADRAVHNLQMTQSSLLKQLEDIEQDIRVYENKAREYVRENKKQLAKTYLRKKHLLEKNHEKRSIALHNIEMLLNSVDEAQSNGNIIDAYKIGSKALQNTLDTCGLKYDNVDEVIAEVRESMDAHKEVQDVLSNTSMTDNMDLSEMDELERELQDMMGETATPTTTPTKSDNNQNLVKNNNPAATTVNPAAAKISDAELLALLADLEVEDKSFNRSSSQSENENGNGTIRH